MFVVFFIKKSKVLSVNTFSFPITLEGSIRKPVDQDEQVVVVA